MKKMINQGPIVRYTASVCEIFFSDFRQKTFSAESSSTPDPDALAFAAEAKKLTDWDGRWFLTGEQLQKKMETTINQPPDVIKRIKEFLEES
jgi:hypothetical protein